MLTNFAECSAMHRSQALFYVFDDWSLFVEGTTSDDEGFGGAELLDNVAQLLAGTCESIISIIFALNVLN
jgi:hypothetical protein